MSYAKLASSVRHFQDRIQGPSLDVLGSSIELLKYEGLVDESECEDGPILTITKEGQRELRFLLTARMRPGATDLNKLIIALKFRFLHLLAPKEQKLQIEIMLETVEIEIARLQDLRDTHEKDTGYLLTWLDQELSVLKVQLKWLENFATR
tara:strand:- start:556 stop:1008 length:453 start_codon:yes stop_codon:yes gene_type:complete